MARKRKTEAPEEPKKTSQRTRSMWSGTISFGLVNIPVRLIMGTRKKDVHFHLLHEKDNARLQRKYVCSADGKEVPQDEIKKAYQMPSDQMVIVEEEELKALAPKASRTIELLYFVDSTEIDPAYFDVPYYLAPGENAANAYNLLLAAMKSTKKAAISQFVLRNKEYIALVRPGENVLRLETMRFPDEIVFADELDWAPTNVKVNERELKTAEALIESLAGKFEPKKLHDDYREAVLQLVKKKAAGQEVVTQPEPENDQPEVIDLMAALQKSLHVAKTQKLKKSA
jgi:DNA end-binding protein Ku